MIRKALKSDVKIYRYGPKGISLYLPLMREMHKKAILKKISQDYYFDVLNKYFSKKKAILMMAAKDNEILSGVIIVGNKNVMHYWQGASKTNAPNLGQGELLQWEAIKWAKESKSKYYDLCVVEEERLPHIAKFKKGFSNEIVPFYYFTKKTLCFRVLSKLQSVL